MRVDIEASDTDLEEVQQTGSKLIGLVGENEQVDVERNLVDAETTLATLNDQCVKRSHKLEAALVNSIHFQDSLMVGIYVMLCCMNEIKIICTSIHVHQKSSFNVLN